MDCRLIDTSGFTNFIQPAADEMVVAVTDSLSYHLDTARVTTTLHALLSSLTAVGVNVTQHQATATPITEGPDGAGTIAMGTADNYFTDTRKIVLSLTSPLAPLNATTFRNNRIHLKPNRSISPPFLRIYRVPNLETEARKVLLPKPVAHTQAALNNTDLATDLVADITWTTSGLPS
jgi:hypothetical protein